MTVPSVREYHLPDNRTIETVLQRMQGSPWKIACDPVRKVRRTHFDTFDWRLHDAGLALSGEHSDDLETSVLYRLGTGGRFLHAPGPPRSFAADFPAGPLRDLLLKTTGIRALLPVAEARLEIAPCNLADRRGKILVKLSLLKGDFSKPGERKTFSLTPRLRVEGVKGHKAALCQILAELDRHPFPETDRDLFEEALDLLSQSPGEYRPKPALALEPDTRADQAVRVILLHLLEVMETNLPGTIDNIDSEFLHDFRVAVRRTRSALAQAKRVFPEGEIQPFRERFKWLGSLTGPTRDLDVFLLKFPVFRESLPVNSREDFDPFLRFLQEHHREEQEKLARTLSSDKVRGLLGEWRSYLESTSPDGPPAERANAPILEVAHRQIRKLYLRLVKEGRSIASESPDEQIHQLRITGKKFRYLLEFFSSLFPAKEIGRLVKATKTLQDFLGEFNDLAVQQEKLQEFSRRLQVEQQTPAATLVVMGRLIEDMARRQQKMRLEFPDHFEAFDRGRLRGLCEKLFTRTKAEKP